MYSWGVSSAGRAPRLQRGGQGFDPPTLHHLKFLGEVRKMKRKKTLTELEIYAERKYTIYQYEKKYIRAFYNWLKWKYYERKHEKEFLTK